MLGILCEVIAVVLILLAGNIPGVMALSSLGMILNLKHKNSALQLSTMVLGVITIVIASIRLIASVHSQ